MSEEAKKVEINFETIKGEINKLISLMDRVEKNIEKLFKFTRKCPAHQEAIDILKIEYHGLKNKLPKDFEEKLEKEREQREKNIKDSEETTEKHINRVETKIDKLRSFLWKGLWFILGTVILLPLVNRIIVHFINNFMTKYFPSVVEYFKIIWR